MRKLIWLPVVLMLIFHQDFWNWGDSEAVFGFLPMGLFYHACLSLTAGVVWWLVCVFAWPEGVDEFEDQTAGEGGDA